MFGAVLLGDPIVMPDGRIGHAEMRVGDTVFMLAGEFPEEQHMSPETLGGSTVLAIHAGISSTTISAAVGKRSASANFSRSSTTWTRKPASCASRARCNPTWPAPTM